MLTCPPRNWIPKERRKPLMASESSEKSTFRYEKDNIYEKTSEKCEKSISRYEKDKVYEKASEKCKNLTSRYKKPDLCQKPSEKCEKLPIRLETSNDYQGTCGQSDKRNNRCLDKNVKRIQTDTEWNDINEVIESYFLISPGDIYPNHKVELQDATITDET